MFKKAERFVILYPWVSAISATAILFLIINIIATPLLNSGDDAFLMYTLGGGYGEEPTNLLHYNYGWHPWLGYIVKSLFLWAPGTNWYSILLLIYHLCGCCTILYVLLKRLGPATAFFFFLILFFFIETRLLLSLSFTGAAFVAAAGALYFLHYELEQGKWKNRNAFFAICIFVLAGMLRLQIAGLVLLLFFPSAIFILKKKKFIQWLAFSLFAIVLLFGLNKIHQHYYINNIPGWKQQETFRQAIFYAYNRPIKHHDIMPFFKDSSEYQLFFGGFFYDSSKFSTERVRTISKQITRQRWMNEKEDREGLYWFFIELRIYILLFAIMITGMVIRKRFIPLKSWALSFFTVVAVYAFLFVFMKITTPIHLGLLMFLLIQLLRESVLPLGNKKFMVFAAITFLLLFGWMGIRVAEENDMNRQRRQEFLCAVNELNKDPQKLFVATDDSFPLSYFYIWDTPGNYPVQNLLYKDRLLTYGWKKTVNRFGIKDLSGAMRHNENVFLLGPALPALEKEGTPAKISDKLHGYQCLPVRKLIPVQ